MNKTELPAATDSLRTHTNDDHHELARRLRNQANLIGTVAHDIRHPLFQLALTVELASAIDARKLEAIHNALGSITRLVDDLDDYGSLQVGQLRLVRRTVHPSAIVKAAVAAFAFGAAARQIEIAEKVGDALPEIWADGDRLQQVMSNLLTNALCLTPPGGRIVVTAADDGDHVRFSVRDSGPGIHPADLPHLFERHWRAAKSAYLGRGLGLAIARDLVTCHGGTMWADNEPDCGARISFTVPVVRRPQPACEGVGPSSLQSASS
jgi:signal transduction histidine kinase